MKKILTSLIAAGVLVAGVAVAGVVAGSTAEAQDAPPGTEAPTSDRPGHKTVIKDVLDELVADGEITQGQADIILAAIQEKREEFAANHPDGFRRGFRRGAHFGFNLRGLLEDGVIDAAELAELPEGNPLTDPDGPFAEALEDGEITVEELREVREEMREQRRSASGADVEGTSA